MTEYTMDRPKFDLQNLWQARMKDTGRWFVVARHPLKNNYHGLLLLFDVEGNLLHAEETGLGYGALFGVDSNDTADWEDHITELERAL